MPSKKLQRYNRLAAQKCRGGKKSYVTEMEDLQIMCAWINGDLSEGQVSKALGYDRVFCRCMRQQAIIGGLLLSVELKGDA